MQYSFNTIRWLLISLLVLLILSCTEDSTVEPPPPYSYNAPEQTDDGWETAAINDVGIEGEKLTEVVNLINYNLYSEVHSILIVKDGKLVFEEYFNGREFDYSGANHHGSIINYDMDRIHNQASVTKSFTSALVGIAIKNGFISSVDEKVFSYFPEYSAMSSEEKENMTLEHLLAMSSGFEWNEGDYPYADQRNDLIQMWNVADPLRHLMAKPLTSQPGTQFYYNSACTILLGEIVKRASGFNLDMFAQKFLFQPMGITQHQWAYFSNGVVFASGDLQVRPRDMAKLGYLYLNKGNWRGNQILSEEWTQKSSEPYIEVNSFWKYGYQWWLREYNINSQSIDSFSARGWGGQTIIVFPELNTVVVMTGGNYLTYVPVDEIVQNYILPAVL